MEPNSDPGRDDSDSPQKLWNIDYILVLILGFLTGTANQMVSPQLAKYAISLGATLTMAGTIVGVFSGISMAMRPFSGAASDLFNRKYVFMFSILTPAIAYGGFLAFHNITAVFICRILNGIGFSFQSVARIAFASEFIPKERMGEGISFATFGIVVSQALGPTIGLWISDAWGYNACFAVALSACVVGLVALATRPYKRKHEGFDIKKIRFGNLIAIDAVPYALLSGLIAMAIQLANSFLVLIGDERGIKNILLFFTVSSICTLASRPLTARVLDRRGLAVLLYPSYVFAITHLALIGAARSLIIILISGICKALSQGVALPAIHGNAVKRLGVARAGVLTATISMGQDLMGSLAPIVGGVLIDGFGFSYGGMFYTFAGITLLGIPGYMLLQRREKIRAAAGAVRENGH